MEKSDLRQYFQRHFGIDPWALSKDESIIVPAEHFCRIMETLVEMVFCKGYGDRKAHECVGATGCWLRKRLDIQEIKAN